MYSGLRVEMASSSDLKCHVALCKPLYIESILKTISDCTGTRVENDS